MLKVTKLNRVHSRPVEMGISFEYVWFEEKQVSHSVPLPNRKHCGRCVGPTRVCVNVVA